MRSHTATPTDNQIPVRVHQGRALGHRRLVSSVGFASRSAMGNILAATVHGGTQRARLRMFRQLSKS
jgi:hypothetical protein